MLRTVAALFAVTMLAFGAQAKEQSCRDQAGRETAAIYVRDCLLTSPATHPPCNDANPCRMIVTEVVRGCDLGGMDAKMCERYRGLKIHFEPKHITNALLPGSH